MFEGVVDSWYNNRDKMLPAIARGAARPQRPLLTHCDPRGMGRTEGMASTCKPPEVRSPGSSCHSSMSPLTDEGGTWQNITGTRHAFWVGFDFRCRPPVSPKHPLTQCHCREHLLSTVNGYVHADKKVEALVLEPHVHRLVDEFGQRFAPAVQAGDVAL